MLRGSGPRHPAPRLFRDAVLRFFKDPLNHPHKWQWATYYWNISDLYSEPEVRALFDTAVRTIQEAGFDPVRLGRSESGLFPSKDKMNRTPVANDPSR